MVGSKMTKAGLQFQHEPSRIPIAVGRVHIYLYCSFRQHSSIVTWICPQEVLDGREFDIRGGAYAEKPEVQFLSMHPVAGFTRNRGPDKGPPNSGESGYE